MSKSRFDKFKEKFKTIFHRSKKKKSDNKLTDTNHRSLVASHTTTNKKSTTSGDDYTTQAIIANTAFVYGMMGSVPSNAPAPCEIAPQTPCHDSQPVVTEGSPCAPAETITQPTHADTSSYSAPVDTSAYSAPADTSAFSAPADSGGSYTPCDTGCTMSM